MSFSLVLLAASAAFGADVAIERPAHKWLLGGFDVPGAGARVLPQAAEKSRGAPDPAYFILGMMSRHFRKGATVLNAKVADPLVRAYVLENADGTMTAALVNLGPRRVVAVGGWDSFPRLPRLYLYDPSKPCTNRFGDLPRPDRTVPPVGGELRVELPKMGMALLTTDYIARMPPPVKGVKVADGRLAWAASDDPDHRYYRVYADGRQIASTTATSCGVGDAGADFSVVSVDRWGNAGDVMVKTGLVVNAEKPILLVPCRASPLPCTTFARNLGFDRLDVLLDGRSELSFFVDSAGGDVAWQSPIDLSKYAGRRLELVLHGADQFGEDPFAGFRMGTEADLPDDVYGEPYRPQFHFTPKYGWSNDPNGLGYYNGQWHLFYQSVACSTIWRPSNAWRHAVSDDLVHWRELKPAIEADDDAAPFSGSAVTCGDRHVLVYTRSGWAGFAEQAVAESTNGVDYVKGGTVLPQRAPRNRDPFVFYHKPTDAWVMALFVGTHDVQKLEILSSKDLRSWRHESYVEGDRGDTFGNPPRRFLHECPILVEVPVEGTDERRWLVAGGSMAYRLGRFDGHVFAPETEVVTPFPQGIGSSGRNAYYKPYYAGQVFNDAPDGRVVYMPWYKLETPAGARFSQGLGLPLEFTLARTPDGLRLRFLPVKELEGLRARAAVPLEKFDGELAEVEYSAVVGNDARILFDLRGVRLAYDAAKGTLSVGDEVSVPWKVENGKFAIRAYLDRIGLEVFSQDGFQVLPDPTARPDGNRRDLSVAASGAVASVACRVWKLNGIWRSNRAVEARDKER